MHLLNNVVDKHVPQLLELYNNQQTDISIDGGIKLTPPKLINNNPSKILDMDIVMLRRSYSDHNALSDVFGCMDLVAGLPDEVDFFHQNARKESDRIRASLQEDTENFTQILARYLEDVKEELSEKEFYQEMREAYFSVLQKLEGTRKITEFHDDLVRVVLERLIKSNQFRTNQLAEQVAQTAKAISRNFSHLKRVTNEAKGQYKSFAETLRSALGDLQKHRQALTNP